MRAVEEAYGATNFPAAGRVTFPAESMVVVAVPPKYAVPMLEKRVEEALVRMTRDGRESVTAPVAAEAVIWLVVPAREVTPELVMVSAVPPTR